ncbi:hypothetical protein [Hymenobacter jeollabukensis]|uniref:Uncharacterized protein n=1 Tax=Hymenobacter jeollabukensis TaxID=2025313 RepID=A0A5R8WSZ2_9BACT|nr:hypothetical protein [Hymenobacter jeollabukensis]TLM93989.1 hypothetical protein FDY95_08120 [Hymenobacter jeollabukensis]
MKLNRRLNQLTEAEYRHLLANYRRYTDFNSLGLFRSLLENDKLEPTQRQRLRDAAIEAFPKFYEFLQLKDPHTYFRLRTLGQELTVADERTFWEQISQAQQRLLADKRLRHRNFGMYSKHSCGYDTCPLNGLMIRPGSPIMEDAVCFSTDRRSPWLDHNRRSDQRRRARKAWANGRGHVEE